MTTRFRLLSDIHLEFHPDFGAEFVAGLDPKGTDTVLMAGDLCNSAGLSKALDLVSAHFPCPVVYVPGNHDYYGASFDEVPAILARAQKRHSNLRVLLNTSATVAGRRILGTTLWFAEHPQNAVHEHLFNDFRLIRNFKPRVYREHASALSFLRRELRPGDVVLSHHLPTRRVISPRFEGSSLNRFFANDLDDLILERQPTLWVHGHTHDSVDATLGSTRIRCNPYGYYGEEVNPNWDPACTADLE